MIFYASIRRELAQSFTATLIVLLTIVMTMMLIRTLGLASKGSVSPQDIFLIMAYLTMSFLPIILTLSLFLSVTSTLSRLYKDSEMAIWFSSGQGVLDFVRPILRFSWPMLFAIALLGLFAWPWANTQVDILRQQYEQRGDLDRIAPGEFQQNKNGKRVFFVDSSSSSSAGGNIFIYARGNDEDAVTTAGGGHVERRGEDGAYLVLEQGQNVSQKPETGEYSISRFASYSTHVRDTQALVGKVTPSKNMASQDLMGSATGRGELSWRAGLALCAFNFLLIGLALAKGNNRSGKSGSMILALLSFAVYYNLLNLGQNWIASGKLGLLSWMLLLHGGVFSLALVFLLKKHYNLALRDVFKKAS